MITEAQIMSLDYFPKVEIRINGDDGDSETCLTNMVFAGLFFIHECLYVALVLRR